MNLQERLLKPYDWEKEGDFLEGFHREATRSLYNLIRERHILQETNNKKKNGKNTLSQAEQNLIFILGLSGMVRNFFTDPSNYRDRTLELARNQDSFISYGNHGFHKEESYGIFYFKNSLSEPQRVTSELLDILWNGDVGGNFEQNRELVRKLGSYSKIKLLDRFIGTIKPYAVSRK